MTATRSPLTPLDRCAAAAATVAAIALLLELTWPHGLEAPATADDMPAAPAPPLVDTVVVGSLADYASISARPLFAFDRRPYVQAVEQAPPPGPRVEFQLTAVILAGETQIALLKSNLSPAVQRVALNQMLDGWTLAEIRPDRVVMRRNAETATVELRPANSGGRPAQGVRVNALASGN